MYRAASSATVVAPASGRSEEQWASDSIQRAHIPVRCRVRVEQSSGAEEACAPSAAMGRTRTAGPAPVEPGPVVGGAPGGPGPPSGSTVGQRRALRRTNKRRHAFVDVVAWDVIGRVHYRLCDGTRGE